MELGVRKERPVHLDELASPGSVSGTVSGAGTGLTTCTVLPLTLTPGEDAMESITIVFTKEKGQEAKIVGLLQATEAGPGPAVVTLEEMLIPSASMAPAFTEH